MALELDLADAPISQSDRTAFPVTGRARPAESPVPVYRCFLSGGSDQYRLGRVSLAGLAALWLGVAVVVQWAAGGGDWPAAPVGLAIASTGVSLSLAVLVSRWAGRGVGLAAGYLAIPGWAIWSSGTPVDVMLAAGIAQMAILVFALVELPNRQAAMPRATAGAAFYFGLGISWILGGPGFVLAVAAVCLGTVLATENSRGMRFFASRTGLGILLASAAARAISRGAVGESFLLTDPARDNSLSALAAACFLAAGVIVTAVSLRTGHGASCLGRLLISWLLGPSLLAIVQVIPAATAITVTMPAWAAVAGLALANLGRRFRAGRKRS